MLETFPQCGCHWSVYSAAVRIQHAGGVMGFLHPPCSLFVDRGIWKLGKKNKKTKRMVSFSLCIHILIHCNWLEHHKISNECEIRKLTSVCVPPVVWLTSHCQLLQMKAPALFGMLQSLPSPYHLINFSIDGYVSLTEETVLLNPVSTEINKTKTKPCLRTKRIMKSIHPCYHCPIRT